MKKKSSNFKPTIYYSFTSVEAITATKFTLVKMKYLVGFPSYTKLNEIGVMLKVYEYVK